MKEVRRETADKREEPISGGQSRFSRHDPQIGLAAKSTDFTTLSSIPLSAFFVFSWEWTGCMQVYCSPLSSFYCSEPRGT